MSYFLHDLLVMFSFIPFAKMEVKFPPRQNKKKIKKEYFIICGKDTTAELLP